MLAWASTSHSGQVTSATLLPQQHYRQHDLAETSRHGQRRSGNAIASMTRRRHRTTAESPRQHRCLHDPGAWCVLPRLVI
jgi:hypothetical protein